MHHTSHTDVHIFTIIIYAIQLTACRMYNVHFNKRSWECVGSESAWSVIRLRCGQKRCKHTTYPNAFTIDVAKRSWFIIWRQSFVRWLLKQLKKRNAPEHRVSTCLLKLINWLQCEKLKKKITLKILRKMD